MAEAMSQEGRRGLGVGCQTVWGGSPSLEISRGSLSVRFLLLFKNLGAPRTTAIGTPLLSASSQGHPNRKRLGGAEGLGGSSAHSESPAESWHGAASPKPPRRPAPQPRPCLPLPRLGAPCQPVPATRQRSLLWHHRAGSPGGTCWVPPEWAGRAQAVGTARSLEAPGPRAESGLFWPVKDERHATGGGGREHQGCSWGVSLWKRSGTPSPEMSPKFPNSQGKSEPKCQLGMWKRLPSTAPTQPQQPAWGRAEQGSPPPSQLRPGHPPPMWGAQGWGH